MIRRKGILGKKGIKLQNQCFLNNQPIGNEVKGFY